MCPVAAGKSPGSGGAGSLGSLGAPEDRLGRRRGPRESVRAPSDPPGFPGGSNEGPLRHRGSHGCLIGVLVVSVGATIAFVAQKPDKCLSTRDVYLRWLSGSAS